MFERCFGLFRLEKGREQYAPHETPACDSDSIMQSPHAALYRPQGYLDKWMSQTD